MHSLHLHKQVFQKVNKGSSSKPTATIKTWIIQI